MALASNNHTLPYLPPEMIGEILLNITNAKDVINTINALLLTPLYYNSLINDNYLWKKLINIHYPYYKLKPTENKLKTLIRLFKCFPNYLDKDNWDIVNLIESENNKYPCSVSYIMMKKETVKKYNTIDYRVIKKLYDTEYVSCMRVYSDIPYEECVINILNNVNYCCGNINFFSGKTNNWRKMMKVFITTHFDEIIKDYLECPDCNCSPLPSTPFHICRNRPNRKKQSLGYKAIKHLMNTIGSTYIPYDIFLS